MHKGIQICIPLIVIFFCFINIHADSLPDIFLDEIIINENIVNSKRNLSAQPVEIIEKSFIEKRFSGNLINTLEALPGIQSMDIGSGFSKPMIRGMGFNRVAVSENGIKQEGQQWGADHGLEIDSFNVENVAVIKGPAALIYCRDAMGGVRSEEHTSELQSPLFISYAGSRLKYNHIPHMD